MTGGQQYIHEGAMVALRSVHGKYLSAQPDGRAMWTAHGQVPGNTSMWRGAKMERLRSKEHMACTCQHSLTVACKSIAERHHQVAGRSSRSKTVATM